MTELALKERAGAVQSMAGMYKVLRTQYANKKVLHRLPGKPTRLAARVPPPAAFRKGRFAPLARRPEGRPWQKAPAGGFGI